MMDIWKVRESNELRWVPGKSSVPRTVHEELKRRTESSSLWEVFHENTKYRPRTGNFLVRSASLFNQKAMRVIQSRIPSDHPDSPKIDLPDPSISEFPRLDGVIRARSTVRDFKGETISLQILSNLLKLGCGAITSGEIEEEVEGKTFTKQKQFRSYPSAGALYPVEFYIAILNVEGVEPGIYYYSPEEHCLRKIKSPLPKLTEQLTSSIPSAPTTLSIPDSSFVVFLSAAFYRSCAKYGSRGYRFCLLEAGHIAQNLQLISEACGLGMAPFSDFYDDQINDLLGMNGVDEAVLYGCMIGMPEGCEDDE